MTKGLRDRLARIQILKSTLSSIILKKLMLQKLIPEFKLCMVTKAKYLLGDSSSITT
jgi:hypothetical protein